MLCFSFKAKVSHTRCDMNTSAKLSVISYTLTPWDNISPQPIDSEFDHYLDHFRFQLYLHGLSTGSEAFQQHRQVMGEDHDASPRNPGGGAVLCGRWDADAAATSPAGAAGTLSKVTHRVCCLMLVVWWGWVTCLLAKLDHAISRLTRMALEWCITDLHG